MSRQREQFVDVALEEWRVSGVRRDWGAVLAGAGVPPASCARRAAPARLRARRGLLVALVVTGLVAIAAPALAVITGSAQWPWSPHHPGVSLAASVSASGGSATVHVSARGGLLYRTTKGAKLKVLAPVLAKRRRIFAWELRSQGGKVTAAAIVTGAATVRLCAPCGAREAGAFTLAGARALALLNGGARLRVQIEGQTLSARIHLPRSP
jgi:hypothetical protein